MKVKKLMKTAVLGLFAALLAGALAGCGKSGKDGGGSGSAKYELNVSGIGGSLNYLPVYIAQEKGSFKEAGLNVEETLFTNGPVQMEALSSDGWDIGCTGVGGVFAGVLGYDAKIVGSSNTDDGTQYVFARNDSPIVAAGQGKNSINDEIYGDANSWKGKSILCNTGSVTQYVLIKMLEGFGLTQDDVTFIAMDPATAYSAFLAGEGDVCVLTGSGGTFKMLDQKDKYTPVARGPLVDSGLMCSFVVNKDSYEDKDTYEAMKVFLKVYFETTQWMKDNEDEVVDYCVDMNDENGSSLDPEIARKYIEADTYYSLDEAIAMMENKAQGAKLSVMEKDMVNVLDFFVSAGSYNKGDIDKFEGHTDVQLLKDVQSTK